MDRRKYGNEGESLATQFLESKGYRIVERNFNCRLGELDVVAEFENTLCFVEVRTRSNARFGGPAITIMSSKQARVIKAALYFLQKYQVRNKMIRFDVISIVGRGDNAMVEHIPNAFDAGM